MKMIGKMSKLSSTQYHYSLKYYSNLMKENRSCYFTYLHILSHIAGRHIIVSTQSQHSMITIKREKEEEE